MTGKQFIIPICQYCEWDATLSHALAKITYVSVENSDHYRVVCKLTPPLDNPIYPHVAKRTTRESEESENYKIILSYYWPVQPVISTFKTWIISL